MDGWMDGCSVWLSAAKTRPVQRQRWTRPVSGGRSIVRRPRVCRWHVGGSIQGLNLRVCGMQRISVYQCAGGGVGPHVAAAPSGEDAETEITKPSGEASQCVQVIANVAANTASCIVTRRVYPIELFVRATPTQSVCHSLGVRCSRTRLARQLVALGTTRAGCGLAVSRPAL
jgi:hypothetical protein